MFRMKMGQRLNTSFRNLREDALVTKNLVSNEVVLGQYVYWVPHSRLDLCFWLRSLKMHWNAQEVFYDLTRP